MRRIDWNKLAYLKHQELSETGYRPKADPNEDT